MSDASTQSVQTEPVQKKPATKRAITRSKVKAKPATVKVPDTSKLDQFGFRLGTLKAKAAALYAAKKGATLGEVKSALRGSTQFNVLTELEHKGYKVERTPVGGEHDRKVTKYHVIVK